jgi:hypothetical protein
MRIDAEVKDMRVRRKLATGVLVLATVVAGACTNPVSPGTHIRAEGVVVRSGTEVLVRADRDGVSGALAVQAASQRGPLTVRMLDHDGDEISPPHGYYLEVRSSAESIARWNMAVEGEFGGTLVGVAPGTANLTFCLMHGAVGRGHDDGCQAVNVAVTTAD